MADKKIPDTNKIDKLKEDLAKRVDAAAKKNTDPESASKSSARSQLDKTTPEKPADGKRADPRPQISEPGRPASASATGNAAAAGDIKPGAAATRPTATPTTGNPPTQKPATPQTPPPAPSSAKVKTSDGAPVSSNTTQATSGARSTQSNSQQRRSSLERPVRTREERPPARAREDNPSRRMAPPAGATGGRFAAPDSQNTQRGYESRGYQGDANYRGPRRHPAPQAYRNGPANGSGRDSRAYRPPPPPPRRMAPPAGATGGRYVAPGPRTRRQHVIPPAAAADGGSAWGPLLLGLLLLLGVIWYAIRHYAPLIDADLTTRANSALGDAGLSDSAQVEIDGRTATLTGNVASQPDSDLAEETVAGTFGVRSVDNQLSIGDADDATSADASARSEPSLSFLSGSDGVQISGTVSDQEYADRIEAAAKETYGAANVSGSIDVDPDTTNPGWWPAVQQLTPDLNSIDNGSLSVADGSLLLTGTAPDEQIKDDIGTRATELVKGQLTVDNQIEFTAAAPPPPPPPAPLRPGYATVYDSSDRIALYGSMPAESASLIEQAFANSEKPVANFIVASDQIEVPAWAESFPESLNAMDNIDNAKVKVQRSGEVVITGTAESEQIKQEAGDKIAAIFTGLAINNEITVVEPEPAPEPEPEPAAPFMQPFATVTDNGSEVKISGLLTASSAEAITKAYENAGRTVESSVSIDERVIQPSWTYALSQSTQNMREIEQASVTISSSNELTISGIADNNSERQQAADNSSSAFGNSVSLRNDIRIKEPDINALFAQIDLAAIRFRTNSAELNADSIAILEQVSEALLQVPSAKIAVEGHTDSTGNNERNQELSAERANTVRSFLINRGIGSDRLTSRGFGSSQPIASNDTVTGRALNRRIEFQLSNGE